MSKKGGVWAKTDMGYIWAQCQNEHFQGVYAGNMWGISKRYQWAWSSPVQFLPKVTRGCVGNVCGVKGESVGLKNLSPIPHFYWHFQVNRFKNDIQYTLILSPHLTVYSSWITTPTSVTDVGSGLHLNTTTIGCAISRWAWIWQWNYKTALIQVELNRWTKEP